MGFSGARATKYSFSPSESSPGPSYLPSLSFRRARASSPAFGVFDLLKQWAEIGFQANWIYFALVRKVLELSGQLNYGPIISGDGAQIIMPMGALLSVRKSKKTVRSRKGPRS